MLTSPEQVSIANYEVHEYYEVKLRFDSLVAPRAWGYGLMLAGAI